MFENNLSLLPANILYMILKKLNRNDFPEFSTVKLTDIFAIMSPHCMHLWALDAPSLEGEAGRMNEKNRSRCVSVR